MKYIYLGLGWIFGIVFLLVAIVVLPMSVLAGLLFFTTSTLVLPPVRAAVYARTRRGIPGRFRALAVLCLMFAAIISIGVSQTGEQPQTAARELPVQAEQTQKIVQRNREFYLANEDSILSALNSAMDAGEYHAVRAAAKKYGGARSEALVELNRRARIKQEEIARIAKTESLLKQVKALPASQHQANLDIYSQLASINPGNAAFVGKVEFYSERVREAKAAQAKVRREQEAAANRQRNIEAQFSAWNGAHRNLEALIKQLMNDPDSFKHVETAYSDRGDHLVVQTTFRGKNGFGGVVTNTITAKVSLSGQVLEVLD